MVSSIRSRVSWRRPTWNSDSASYCFWFCGQMDGWAGTWGLAVELGLVHRPAQDRTSATGPSLPLAGLNPHCGQHGGSGLSRLKKERPEPLFKYNLAIVMLVLASLIFSYRGIFYECPIYLFIFLNDELLDFTSSENDFQPETRARSLILGCD